MNREESAAEVTMRERFRRFAHRASQILGAPWVFIAACLAILVWACTGPLFHYSNTWQLVINTGTTIVTFLMVFLIQNTQNRDTRAMHLKLDELIRAIKGARNKLVDLEEMSDEELDQLQEQFQRICGARQSKTKPEKAAAASRKNGVRHNGPREGASR
ncbi:MAG TPA: low affinity iron permease family protein [Candidatus Acidoferrum sp.]|nr:low affinity iron permease family protein [Candidatus Acidoferrum sp.]